MRTVLEVVGLIVLIVGVTAALLTFVDIEMVDEEFYCPEGMVLLVPGRIEEHSICVKGVEPKVRLNNVFPE